ncbi:glycosyltransferase [Cryobacterium psychrophilum]|uniref:Glycosyltransferase n=1 Tax=Cryobacterium psychrophilum TaxID=41988 RepID=A0A4Y8KT13_9MICO|nr:nucleotide disphospho-sugar-binding domain-containing protein [Cryobacterium psychrophilum]TDW28649.1 MGT family glycosyltransferase [Cryobacterium psychrophilum]TFD82312.1 glycosyltransferase [Cryobacterium psychrophilum]
MTLLIISPDYASHLFPLATLGTAWQEAGERVVVASGPATADIVRAFGFERENLQLGRGSNPGVIRAEAQPRGEDDALRGFFAATRLGMVETLRFQAEARSNDLLWNPVQIARSVQQLVERVQPDQVIVDHLAFAARLGLLAAGVRHADVVLGHPSALPVVGEVYGYPPTWPSIFRPDINDLAALRLLCEAVRDSFTAQWNAALLELDPQAVPSTDAFRETGDVLLLNYPAELHSSARGLLLPEHAFLGSAVRSEATDAEVEAWLEESGEPVVYVSFGSFLSVRGDVLERVVAALHGLPVRVALATGSTDPTSLGPIPTPWLVRGFLPQVRLLEHSVLAVSHGGNNSVTEAMTAGVPLLLLPFSTDQFAGAAALDAAGFGETLDPNIASTDEIRAAAARLLLLAGEPRGRLRHLGVSLSGGTGPRRAFEALMGVRTG